ncbi:hypothetical protein Poli38472_007160 [Pythium oligandrum]|uniref:FHA domain-containing protein n=1 Tax=Pythium oligandrum TaxID=41045 RepID=A0A8K1C9Z8_PYTOL|nr:hypothetical protein Poli38472_007160 [Pythium oligandrum]|eukprot:TMW59015.1 hypothetical protein Poli38472_007160 [Pythium oligandrum]
MSTTMELPPFELPKLNLGTTFPASRPKFLAPLEPPTFPFTAPAWMLPHEPRSIALLDVYKSHEQLATYTVDKKPLYLIGRNAVACDIVLNHCSISRLHAAIIHHKDGSTYLVDLGSFHGTFIDDMQLKALQPTLIVHGSVLKFGASSRSYSFRSFESREQIVEIVQSRIGLEPDEMELQQNTMMNRALSYRLGISIPVTHKLDAEGDDPMAPGSTRQIEEPSSAAALIRRTQSEDNSMVMGTFPIHPHINLVQMEQEERRKRSRTQSAGPLTGNNSTAPNGALQISVQNGSSPVNGAAPQQIGADVDPLKHVHFIERSPEVIPDCFARFLNADELSPLTLSTVNETPAAQESKNDGA